MKDFSYITHSHPGYIENLYQDFVQNPESVDPEFRKFFEGFDFAISNGKPDINGAAAAPAEAAPLSRTDAPKDGTDWRKELAVYRMILGYRNKGHLIARTNPIRERKDQDANLQLP